MDLFIAVVILLTGILIFGQLANISMQLKRIANALERSMNAGEDTDES